MDCKYCGSHMNDVSSGVHIDTVIGSFSKDYECPKCGTTLTQLYIDIHDWDGNTTGANLDDEEWTLPNA